MSARDLPAIEFDSSKHEYRVAGVVVPNVTRILEPLCSWEHVPEDVLARKGDLGTAVHLATYYSDKGTLDASTVSDEVAGYLAGWHRFLAEKNPTLIHRERRVHHPDLGYAGTLDVEMDLDGDLCIGDIKSGMKHRVHGVQIAAYALARKREEAWPIFPKRYGIYLFPDPDGRYELVPYTRASDYPTFCGLATIHHWRQS